MLLLLWLITVKITVISRMTDDASVKVRSKLHTRIMFQTLSKVNRRGKGKCYYTSLDIDLYVIPIDS